MSTRRWPDACPQAEQALIDLGNDGWWHGWVTIGIKDDGAPDRRHRKARTAAEVTRKVRELERTRDSGHTPCAGRPVTVVQWMETWLRTIAPLSAGRKRGCGGTLRDGNSTADLL